MITIKIPESLLLNPEANEHYQKLVALVAEHSAAEERRKAEARELRIKALEDAARKRAEREASKSLLQKQKELRSRSTGIAPEVWTHLEKHYEPAEGESVSVDAFFQEMSRGWSEVPRKFFNEKAWELALHPDYQIVDGRIQNLRRKHEDASAGHAE